MNMIETPPLVEMPAAVLAPDVVAARLAAAGTLLRELGRPGSEFALLSKAMEISAFADGLRRLIPMAQDQLDIDLALLSHQRLLAQLDGQKTRQADIESTQRRASDLAALDMLANLPGPQDPIEPVAGRLLYILHHSRPYLSNGYATRGHGLATGMLEAGIDLHCLTRPGFPLDVKADLGDIAAQDVVEKITYLRDLEPKRSGKGRAKIYLQEAADVIEARIRAIRPQAVIVASNYISALPTLIAARRTGVPVAYEVRGFWEITEISREPERGHHFDHHLKIRIESEVAAAADHVFTLSNPMAEELVRRGVAPRRVSLLQNSCDPNLFKPHKRDGTIAKAWNLPDGVPVIGYVGSFVQYEGLDDLTRACGLLRRQGKEFRLVMVGNEKAYGNDRGPITNLVLSIAEKEGLSDWLIMPGRVPHEDVEKWYSVIDIAPFPRKAQAVTELVTPLKPLEALAMEKAVIMSSVRAMAEMVRDGETGLVFQKGDIEDFARKIATLIDDADLRTRLGKAGRRWVETDRTWLRMGERVVDWLATLAR